MKPRLEFVSGVEHHVSILLLQHRGVVRPASVIIFLIELGAPPEELRAPPRGSQTWRNLWGGGFAGAAVLGKTFVTLQEGSEARS